MPSDPPQPFQGHRWHAAVYGTLNRGLEHKFMPQHRAYVAGEADGLVLEVGAGTGANFSYYKRADKVIAAEPDPFMLERARRRLAELGADRIELARHPAEDLPYEDGSFDHVVSTLVLCTVRDPRRSLSEVKRVLKPGGTFRFVEHVRFDGGLRGWLQDTATPVWRWIAAGCHPNRRTLEAILQAGFQVGDVRRHAANAFSPVVVGAARAVR